MPELTTSERDALGLIEDDLIADQVLEVTLSSDDSPVQKTVDKYAKNPVLYLQDTKVQAMVFELEKMIKQYTKDAGKKGRLLSTKQMDRFLAASERIDKRQKARRLIFFASEKQAARRLEYAYLDLEKNVDILRHDIKLFKKNAKLAGFSAKETLKQLVDAGTDKAGIVQGFAKRAKSVAVAAVRREKAAAKIDEYRRQVKPTVKYDWITISTKPCPDCTARAGVALTYDEWVAKGLPGAGRTICGVFCNCDIIPTPIVKEMGIEVKEYNWDPEKLVLTTASEARTFGAKSHKAQKKEKVRHSSQRRKG